MALHKQLWDAATSSDDKATEVTRLLAAGADPDGHKDAVRTCARAASLPAAPAPLPRPCQPRARCSPPPLAHPPCAPHRCEIWQGGATALMRASAWGHTAIVQALLRAGAQLSEPRIRAMNGPRLTLVLGLLGKAKMGRVDEQKDRLVKAVEDGALASFANNHLEAAQQTKAIGVVKQRISRGAGGGEER